MSADLDTYKVMVVGEVNVGKTCLVKRMLNLPMPETTVNSIGVDFANKTHLLKDNRTSVRVQLWDTAGLEKYRGIVVSHYRQTKGCMVVYSVTDRSSFDAVKTHIQTAQENAGNELNIVIVGNKVDLVERDPSARQVT